MTQLALDLTQYHRRYERGDITVFLTWFGGKHKPVMVLVNANALGTDQCLPAVIPQENAWIWSEEHGSAKEAARSAFVFATAMGLSRYNQITLIRITSVIRDYIDDLVQMPVKPTSEVVVADAFRTDRETGKVTHQEIISRV
jgi:hypothetical protein